MALYENDTYCEFNFTQILLDGNEEELFLSKFNYVIVGPLLVGVICLGFAGNILSALVFLTSTSRPRIYYYLITLAVWDTILLLCSLFLYGLPVLFFGKFYPQGPLVAIYPLIYMLSNAAHSVFQDDLPNARFAIEYAPVVAEIGYGQSFYCLPRLCKLLCKEDKGKNGSIWTIVLLSLERYFALCRPLKYLTWNSKLRAKRLLAALCLTASVYNVPRYLELGVVQCFDTSVPLAPHSNRTTYPKALVVMGNGIRDDQFYRTLYKVAGGLLFFSAGPLLALLILTWKVFVELRKNASTVRHYVTSKKHIEFDQRSLKQTYNIYPRAERKRNTLAAIRMSETPADNDVAASPITFKVPAAPARNGSREGRFRNGQAMPKPRKWSSRPSLSANNKPTARLLATVSNSGDGGVQTNVDWMLVVVMIKFCVCHTMPTLLDACETVMGTDWWQKQSPYVDTWVNVSNFLVVLNSSCNILIYLAASAKFRHLMRRDVKRLIKCRWRRLSSSSSSSKMEQNNESSGKKQSQISYHDTFNNNNDHVKNNYCSCSYMQRHSYGEIGSSSSLLNKNRLSHISENPSSCDRLPRDASNNSFFLES